MNLTATDAKILVAASAMVVLMSFLFPALGMAGTEQTQSDIPEFNITTSRFDFAGDLPQFPTNPTSGVLNHSSDKFDDFRGNIQFELGPGDDGNRTFLVANSETEVTIQDVEASTELDNHTFSSNGEEATLTGNGYEIDVHAEDISTGAGEYEWIATKRPQDSDLPLIGGIADFSDKLVSVVAWVATTFVVLSQRLIEGSFNVGGIIFDVLVFLIDLMHWLITTYFNSVDSAPGYAKVVLTVPGVMLFYEFSKLTIIGINTVNPLS